MSTASFRPTAAKRSRPGSRAIPTMPPGSPPGARRRTRSARATAASSTNRCRPGWRSTASSRSRRSWARDRGRGRRRRLRRSAASAGWMARGASAAAPSEMEMFANEAIERAPALYRRGAPSDRGQGGGEAPAAVAVAARRHHAARARSRGVRPQAARRPAAARRQRAGRAVHVRERAAASASRSTSPRPTSRAPSFRYKIADKFGALRWSEGGYGWVVSGPDDKPRLKGIASALYEQLDIRTPPAPPPGAARKISSCRGADRRACCRATASSAPRARHRRSRGARCAR